MKHKLKNSACSMVDGLTFMARDPQVGLQLCMMNSKQGQNIQEDRNFTIEKLHSFPLKCNHLPAFKKRIQRCSNCFIFLRAAESEQSLDRDTANNKLYVSLIACCATSTPSPSPPFHVVDNLTLLLTCVFCCCRLPC